MPTKAKRQCTYPGCYKLVVSSRCAAHPYRVDRNPDVKRMYNSKQWQIIRRTQLRLAVIPSLADYPLCAMCYREGNLVRATEVDHISPHRGDETKFFEGPFQCLCKRHHSSKTKAELGI